MDLNKLKKSMIWGISTVIGLAIAEGIYRTGTNAIDKRNLIGDGEIVSDEIMDDEELDPDVSEDDLPF